MQLTVQMLEQMAMMAETETTVMLELMVTTAQRVKMEQTETMVRTDLMEMEKTALMAQMEKM